jgi:hypothetical protein
LPQPHANISLTATELAESAAFDMSMVRESLDLSYERRAIQNQAAPDVILEMARADQEHFDVAQSADPATQRR